MTTKNHRLGGFFVMFSARLVKLFEQWYYQKVNKVGEHVSDFF